MTRGTRKKPAKQKRNCKHNYVSPLLQVDPELIGASDDQIAERLYDIIAIGGPIYSREYAPEFGMKTTELTKFAESHDWFEIIPTAGDWLGPRIDIKRICGPG